MVEAEDIHFSRKGVLNWWAQDELAELIRETMISKLREGPLPHIEDREYIKQSHADALVEAERSLEEEYRAWFDANVRVTLPEVVSSTVRLKDGTPISKQYRGRIKARVPLYDGNLESVYYQLFQSLLKLEGYFSVRTGSYGTWSMEVVAEGKSNFHIGQEVQDESIYWIYEAEKESGFGKLEDLFGAENEVRK